jgi:hypothetical protein
MLVVMILGEGGVRSQSIEGMVSKLGYSITPLYPNTDDHHLSKYFKIEIQNRDEAERIAGILRSMPGVSAAYTKPVEELP